MRLNGKNCITLGSLNNIAELAKLALSEDLNQKTIRESGDSHQRETNIVIGLFDIIKFIPGMYNREVMCKYDKFIDEIADVIKSHYNYKCIELVTFCIIKLKPGGKIYPHIDDEGFEEDSVYKSCHRIHIPVQTNEDVIFTLSNTEYHLDYGKIIEIDNLVEHSVVNNGKDDRVHVLLDVYGRNKYYNDTLNPTPKECYIKDK